MALTYFEMDQTDISLTTEYLEGMAIRISATKVFRRNECTYHGYQTACLHEGRLPPDQTWIT